MMATADDAEQQLAEAIAALRANREREALVHALSAKGALEVRRCQGGSE